MPASGYWRQQVEQKDDKQDLMTRYFLGLLPELDRQRIEADFFADDILFEELGALEVDLIEDYLDDRLSEHYRAGFERHFPSSPERLRRLTFAIALRNHSIQSLKPDSSPHAVRRRTWWLNLISLLRTHCASV